MAAAARSEARSAPGSASAGHPGFRTVAHELDVPMDPDAPEVPGYWVLRIPIPISLEDLDTVRDAEGNGRLVDRLLAEGRQLRETICRELAAMGGR